MEQSLKKRKSVVDIEDLHASEHRFDDVSAASISELLERFYDANKRDLPWRRVQGSEQSKAYAIWVSEVMLQQTQVVTVIPFFERWMAKFPTLQHLADADTESVLQLWSGLGFYRRANMLMAGAKQGASFYFPFFHFTQILRSCRNNEWDHSKLCI